MAVIFDKCCFCIDLRTGCLIIGYLNLIASILYTLWLILALAAVRVFTAQIKYQEIQQLGNMLTIMGIIFLVFLIIYLAFSIALLVGLHEYKRGHIKAYLIYAVVFTVLYTIDSFVSSPIEVVDVVIYLFDLILNIYFLLVIKSYYEKMDNRANRPAIYITA